MEASMTTFRVQKPNGFQLQAANDFYAGFTPGTGMAAAAVDHLTLAFRLDRTFEPVAVALREERESLVLEVAGSTDHAAVEKQVGRMLGFEPGAEGWLAVAERDEVVARLQQAFLGFFTAAKASPYDAATWAVIAPRMNQNQAAAIKQALARELGDRVALHGREQFVFPAPAQLATLRAFPGLADEKVTRLRGIAEAALAGRLDAEYLRDLGENKALSELQTLRGVGPWAASHIYYRGAAPTDGLPTAEPRVLHGLAHAYQLESPSVATFQRLAERWRPFRMWVCVLLSRHLARSGGWHAPGLAHERAAAGRALARRTTRHAQAL
jgi:3-methyladenine DNA glycosylase/8-oxoguanine DNA glycosylase